MYETVAELLSDESRWTNGWYAVDATKRWVAPTDEKAVKWCAVGGIYAVCGTDMAKADLMLMKLRLVIGQDNIPLWQSTRTHAEVLDAVRKAGI